MKRHIKKYLEHLQTERGLSPRTIDVYQRDLLEFAKFVKKSTLITRNHIRGFLVLLEEKNNQAITKRRKITSLKNFFRFLMNENLLKEDPTSNMQAIKVQKKEPKYLTTKEIQKLMQTVQKEKSKYAKRNEVIIRTLAETGIRLSELTNLNAGDVNVAEKTISVVRKGNKEQTLPINMKLNVLLKDFVKNKESSSPLLVSNYKRRITNRRVGLLVQGYFRKADIEKRNISCHSLRHSFCVRLLEQGVDIKTIQILAGHSSIETTSLYLHIAKGKLRKEVAKVEI